MIQDSRLVNHEEGSHTFSDLRGLAISVPLGFDSLAPQHSTPNIEGDRDNSKKKSNLLNLGYSESLCCVKMELFVSSSQNKQF